MSVFWHKADMATTLSDVRFWGNGKCPADLRRDAKAAWKRFIWCLRALGHEAEPLRQMALAEIAAHAA